jgi:drug/metabolite transporter (DMT)-like permease
MTPSQQAVVVASLVSLIGVGADGLLKAASQHPHGVLNRWLAGGLLLTFAFALGWLVLMRHMKLATAGALYAVTSTLLLAIVGVVFFQERLSANEVAGIAFAVGAVSMLARFSG